MHFLFDAFLLALDDAWNILFPDNLVSVFTEEFSFCYVRHLVDFGDNTEFFLEFVEGLNPLVVFLLLVERLINLTDVLEVHHVKFNVFGWEGLFFG